MKILNYQDSNFKIEFEKLLSQFNATSDETIKNVNNIISGVKNFGDKFLIEQCNKFDGANFKKADDLKVSKSLIDNSFDNIDNELIQALKLSYDRIKKYHEKQLPQDFSYVDDEGVTLGNRWQAIESISVYAPGGSAIYPSSVLMSAVPAIVAGVKDITVTVPSQNGKIPDIVLAACKICKIDKIYKIGGASAIAAMTFGTETIKKVNKIVGPGNSYVALAKKELFGHVGIDMIAGPTDILIISDSNSKPSWIAADLLSQLEHGPDSKAILIIDDINLANEVCKKIVELSFSLPRKNIIDISLKNSAIIIVKNIETDASCLANQLAPEHLEIMTQNPEIIANKIINAGAIFLGRYTPEAIGDYIAGPSHTLPTMSSAKFSSGLSVFDFLKRISVISCNKKSLENLSNATSLLAKCEGFDAHKLSTLIRFN